MINKLKYGDWYDGSSFVDDVAYHLYLCEVIDKNIERWNKYGTMRTPYDQKSIIENKNDYIFKKYYDKAIILIRKDKIEKIWK